MSQYRAFSQWKSNTLYLPKYCASKQYVSKNELDDLQKRRAEEFRQYQIRLLITETNFSDLLGAAQTQSYNRLFLICGMCLSEQGKKTMFLFSPPPTLHSSIRWEDSEWLP